MVQDYATRDVADGMQLIVLFNVVALGVQVHQAAQAMPALQNLATNADVVLLCFPPLQLVLVALLVAAADLLLLWIPHT